MSTEELAEPQVDEATEEEPEAVETPQEAGEDSPEDYSGLGDAEEEEVESKPEERTEEKPAEEQTLKFNVSGEEKSFTPKEIQEVLNQSDYLQRATQKFEEAKSLREKIDQAREQYSRDKKSFEEHFVLRPFEYLVDLLATKTGDPEQAQEMAVRLLEPALIPIYEERQLPPQERELRALKRREARLERQMLAERQRRAEADRQAEAERQSQQEQTRSMEFENKVVAEMDRLGVKNDGFSEWKYHQVMDVAKAKGQELTPFVIARILQDERRKAGVDRTDETIAQEAERLRKENIQKAKALRAKQGSNSGPKPKRPPASQASRKRISLDDLREKWEA